MKTNNRGLPFALRTSISIIFFISWETFCFIPNTFEYCFYFLLPTSIKWKCSKDIKTKESPNFSWQSIGQHEQARLTRSNERRRRQYRPITQDLLMSNCEEIGNFNFRYLSIYLSKFTIFFLIMILKPTRQIEITNQTINCHSLIPLNFLWHLQK